MGRRLEYPEESAAETRAALSRYHLPDRWRSVMEKWSVFRGQAWRINQGWSAAQLFVHAERLKGEGEWTPLLSSAPTQITLTDQCVAHLVGCVVAESWEREVWTPEWDPLPRGLWDDDELDTFRADNARLEAERRQWEEKRQAARERDGAVLLIHYLLPHVRMYQKLRVLKISERTFYYRLNSALDRFQREYQYRLEDPENVQS